MLAKRVVPVMLVKGQTLYKGTKFNPWRSIGLAKQAAMIHARRGVDELCILDVTATAEGHGPDLELVKELSDGLFTPLTVGGGVRSLQDIDALLRAGADKVCIGGAKQMPLIQSAADRFGRQAIVVSIDAGPSRETLPHVAAGFYDAWGAGEILLQCVERDGMMEGYDLDLIRAVSSAVDIPVIASCGAGAPEHMHQALQAGADAVAAGAMFAFTDHTPASCAKYLKAKGWEMRCA